MTTLNSALNFNFASAESARIAYGERAAEEAIAAQLKQATTAGNEFKVGATITARYQYKVGEDGALIPQQTQITTDAPDERSGQGTSRRQGRPSYREQAGNRQPTFSDLALPKPQLTPTDELALFATTVQTAAQAPATTTAESDLPPVVSNAAASSNVAVAEAVDEQGAPVQAEVITPKQARNDNNPYGNFSTRAQFSVATLYARNSDLVYNVTPITSWAA